ncbi:MULTISPECIES: hypothetical protein [unclassified Saccharothrix]|uniref:hypothetical protein n=1 Tax=unclassified Saccharothrix TaxID=2593673 RepID=UPI00307F83C5
MEPRRGVVAPELERWCRDAGDGDRRTAVVRLRGTAEVGQAVERLGSLGMEVTSSGPGSVIGTVTPPAVRRIGQQTWVLAVEGPRTLRSLRHG